ncbi:MAG: Calx-beta domain-containing protein, partial [Candidatus Eutrophobiaceae bacterium]
VADDTDTTAETYSIKLSSVDGYTLVEPSNAATGDLILLTPMLQLTSVTSSASEGGQIEVALAASSPFAQGSQQVLLRFSGTGITAGDLDGGLEIAATADFGSGTTATVSVNVLDDRLYEGVERYTLMLAKPSGVLSYNIDPDNLSAVGALADAQSVPALSLTAASAATEGNDIQLTVTSNIAIATTAPDIGFTLTFAARSSSGIIGADFGGNYADLTHVLTELEFNGGEIAMVEIATVDDAIYEGNEDYTATLSVPTGATLDTDAAEDGTLADNDDTPALSLTAASTATEGNDIQLTVTSNIAIATTAPDIGFTLTFAARSSSGITGADFGGNYADLTHVLTELEFNGGEIAMVEIATVDDAIYEGNEDYTATLSVPTGAMLDTDAAEDGTLTDNDTPALSLTIASAATEGDNIQLTVTSDIAIATTAPDIGFTLTFAARSGSGITGADFGGNYADLTQALTGVAFTGGSGTTATVLVATVNDTLYEGNEDYAITLSATTGATLGSDFSEDGTLADNDTPALSLTVADTVTEGNNIELTVTSDTAIAATAPNIGFTLTLAARSGSGITGADFGGNYADLTHVLT